MYRYFCNNPVSTGVAIISNPYTQKANSFFYTEGKCFQTFRIWFAKLLVLKLLSLFLNELLLMHFSQGCRQTFYRFGKSTWLGSYSVKLNFTTKISAGNRGTLSNDGPIYHMFLLKYFLRIQFSWKICFINLDTPLAFNLKNQSHLGAVKSNACLGL